MGLDDAWEDWPRVHGSVGGVKDSLGLRFNETFAVFRDMVDAADVDATACVHNPSINRSEEVEVLADLLHVQSAMLVPHDRRRTANDW